MKDFDKIPRKIGVDKEKEGVSEILVEAVMNFYNVVTWQIKDGYVHSDRFSVEVGVHQCSIL